MKICYNSIHSQISVVLMIKIYNLFTEVQWTLFTRLSSAKKPEYYNVIKIRSLSKDLKFDVLYLKYYLSKCKDKETINYLKTNICNFQN